MDPNENPDDFSWLPPELAKKAEWMPAKGDRPEGMCVSVGGRVGGTVATLRFFGEDLDPDKLTRLLGCEPTATHQVGDPFTKGSSGRHWKSSWRLESRLEKTHSIDDHVGDLLSRVSDDLAVWRELACFKPDILFGLFLSGFKQSDAVSPQVLGVLAVRGITLGMDIYCAFDD